MESSQKRNREEIRKREMKKNEIERKYKREMAQRLRDFRVSSIGTTVQILN
jgi:hypothetical protein